MAFKKAQVLRTTRELQVENGDKILPVNTRVVVLRHITSEGKDIVVVKTTIAGTNYRAQADSNSFKKTQPGRPHLSPRQ